MKRQTNRYAAEGAEARFEPGSRGRVLHNRLGIRSVRAIARAESERLLEVTERLLDETEVDQCFTAADICRMHRLWLGDVFEWAGEYRQVNLGKDGFMFAAAPLVPGLMAELERGPLRRYTPCRFATRRDQAEALAVVHAELVLIHPFREGNGRCARLLATLMALQAGLPALDFGGIRGEEKRRYIAAVHAALGRNYGPMIGLFERVIARTERSQARLSRG